MQLPLEHPLQRLVCVAELHDYLNKPALSASRQPPQGASGDKTSRGSAWASDSLLILTRVCLAQIEWPGFSRSTESLSLADFSESCHFQFINRGNHLNRLLCWLLYYFEWSV